MNTYEDLKKIKEKASKCFYLRENKDSFRVTVGMATCGITAGAREVFSTLIEAVCANELHDVVVTQVGCLGECALEPLVEVIDSNNQRTIYVHVNPEIARLIVEKHLINKEVVTKYKIENYR